MAHNITVESEPDRTILMVGQDPRGRWMVQENHGLLEGSFVSREAAIQFARWERHAFPGATVEMVSAPLTSLLEH